MKLPIFTTNIGRPTIMIRFLASITAKKSKRNTKRKGQFKKELMEKILTKNYPLHMWKDRNMLWMKVSPYQIK